MRMCCNGLAAFRNSAEVCQPNQPADCAACHNSRSANRVSTTLNARLNQRLVMVFSRRSPSQVPAKPQAIMATMNSSHSENTKPAKPNTRALGACCRVMAAAKVDTVLKRSDKTGDGRGQENPGRPERGLGQFRAPAQIQHEAGNGQLPEVSGKVEQ